MVAPSRHLSRPVVLILSQPIEEHTYYEATITSGVETVRNTEMESADRSVPGYSGARTRLPQTYGHCQNNRL
jgi:hypothetical protein